MTPNRAEAIAALTAEGLDVTEWRDDAGAYYPSHTHDRREVRIVLEGSMTIGTPNGSHELGPGDRIDIDANEPHDARVGPDGVHYLAGSDRR